MDLFKQNQAFGQVQAADYDEGLRAYMLGIYNYMTSALILTGIVAWFAGNSPAVMGLLYQIDVSPDGAMFLMGMKPLGWVVAFAPLAFILAIGMISSLSLFAVQAMFWAFAGVMGLSMASIFMVYTGESITRVFLITAIMFGGMSLYGYTTKRDLTAIGSFLIMGMFGIFIASIVNLFLQSSAVHWAISIIGVVVFTGLTAYDTQRLKATYYQVAGNVESAGKAAIYGALNLYLDFINLFIMLLRLMGDRR